MSKIVFVLREKPLGVQNRAEYVIDCGGESRKGSALLFGQSRKSDFVLSGSSSFRYERQPSEDTQIYTYATSLPLRSHEH